MSQKLKSRGALFKNVTSIEAVGLYLIDGVPVSEVEYIQHEVLQDAINNVLITQAALLKAFEVKEESTEGIEGNI